MTIHAEPDIVAKGELLRYLAPLTLERLISFFPLEGNAARIGSILYFQVPSSPGMGVEKGRVEGEQGLLAYWPMGKAVAIYLEKTRSYSPMNPLGRITGNLPALAKVKEGRRIAMSIDYPEDG